MNEGIPDYKLFIDLDGVLVDFEAGVYKVTGKRVNELQPVFMWPALARYEDFYGTLDWMPDGKELWNYVKDKSPVILTGLPIGKWAEAQKRAWCSRELGNHVPVMTCMSREKANRGRKATPEGLTPVLVDDRIPLQKKWMEMGGIFIHHTSAGKSIEALSKLGI